MSRIRVSGKICFASSKGREICLEYEEVYVALDCVRTIVTTTVALERTLSPEVATGILSGLVKDSQTSALALRRGLGFTKNFDEKCDIKKGTPIGSSTQFSKPNSVCYTLSSGSGCGVHRDSSSSGKWHCDGWIVR